MFILVLFRHLIKAVLVSQSIYHYDAKRTVWKIFVIYSKSNRIFLFLYIWFLVQHSINSFYAKSNSFKIRVLI